MLYDREKAAVAKYAREKSEMGGDPFGTTAHFGRVATQKRVASV